MSVELLTHVVGFTASVIAFVLWLPQAHRVWNLRHQPEALRGISLGTQSLVITNSLLWFGYGALEQAFWIAAPGFINLPLAAGTMVMVLRARRKTHPRNASSAIQSSGTEYLSPPPPEPDRQYPALENCPTLVWSLPTKTNTAHYAQRS